MAGRSSSGLSTPLWSWSSLSNSSMATAMNSSSYSAVRRASGTAAIVSSIAPLSRARRSSMAWSLAFSDSSAALSSTAWRPACCSSQLNATTNFTNSMYSSLLISPFLSWSKIRAKRMQCSSVTVHGLSSLRDARTGAMARGGSSPRPSVSRLSNWCIAMETNSLLFSTVVIVSGRLGSTSSSAALSAVSRSISECSRASPASIPRRASCSCSQAIASTRPAKLGKVPAGTPFPPRSSRAATRWACLGSAAHGRSPVSSAKQGATSATVSTSPVRLARASEVTADCVNWADSNASRISSGKCISTPGRVPG
mmetsp:Transcript_38599/g.86813  ORF Transcript_38599/g.86813 Transcript_38599/m.86813 type:complete len:311 (-) Transcript_38599:121-1053(-)